MIKKIILFSLGTFLLADSSTTEWHDSNKSVQKSWNQSKIYCEDLTIDDKNDWRLPSVDELKLAYKRKQNFSNIKAGFYWSSTEYESYP